MQITNTASVNRSVCLFLVADPIDSTEKINSAPFICTSSLSDIALAAVSRSIKTSMVGPSASVVQDRRLKGVLSAVKYSWPGTSIP